MTFSVLFPAAFTRYYNCLFPFYQTNNLRSGKEPSLPCTAFCPWLLTAEVGGKNKFRTNQNSIELSIA